MEPNFALIDGGALWSSFNTIRYKATTPPPEIEVQPESSASVQASEKEPANTSAATIRTSEDHPVNTSTPADAAITTADRKGSATMHLERYQCTSPELFEKHMLGKSKKKKPKMDTDAGRHGVGLEKSESESSSKAKEAELKCDKGTKSEESSGTSQDQKMEVASKDSTYNDEETNDVEDNISRIPDYLAEFIPEGYNFERRRSDRLEARSLEEQDRKSQSHNGRSQKCQTISKPGTDKLKGKVQKKSTKGSRSFSKKPVQILAEAIHSRTKSASTTEAGKKPPKIMRRHSPEKNNNEQVEEMSDEESEETLNATNETTSTNSSSSEGNGEPEPGPSSPFSPPLPKDFNAEDLSVACLLIRLSKAKDENKELALRVDHQQRIFEELQTQAATVGVDNAEQGSGVESSTK